jgi:hypothetical protein
MNCPKCNKMMTHGRLLGDRYKIKWMNDSDKLFFGIIAINSIKLGTGMLSGRPKVEGFRCDRCQIIVIDERIC